MQKYSKYKDSGVKWLGEIPSHWETLPGFAIFKENKEKNSDLRINTVLSLSYGKIIQKKDLNEGLVPAEYNTYQIVRPGNIIIRCTDLQNDKTSLRTGFVKNEGIITGAYLGLIVNKNYNSSYIHYFLHAWDITKEIYRYGSGLRQSLSWVDLKRLPILIPSYDEQNAIVSYLDSVTSKIDEAIAQQQKMIDLLNERKQIIINDAVTKGLDPKAKMKDSGIDWIGQIPEHWETIQLKKYAKIILGKMLSNLQNNETEYICAKDVHYGNIDISDLKKMNFSKSEKEMYEVKKGDLLIVEGGAGAGGCAIYNYEKTGICIQNSIMIVRCNEKIINEYVCFFLQSINEKGYVEYVCNKATIPHFTKEKVGSVTIPVPSRTEQLEIVKYVKNNISPINLAIESANKQIALLQERKQIIINDVVTGKVKVV